MELSIILIFIVVFLTSYFVLKRPKNLPPGYSGIPYIGSLLFMRKFPGKRPHIVIYEESKRLGNVFRWYMGNQLVVALIGYDVIHEALVTKAEVYSDRPNFQNAVFPTNEKEKGILFNKYDESWRELRRFTLQALRDFGVGKASTEEKIRTETEAVTSILLESEGKSIFINGLMQKLVANVIFSIIFGKRYDYEDPEFDRLRTLTNVVVSGSGPVSAANFMPKFLASLVNRKDVEDNKHRAKSVLDMRTYVFDQIAEHEATFDDENIRDFVDIYLKTERQGNATTRKFVTKHSMFRVIFELFLAGSETTSTTLDWAFLYMIEFPDVQKKCQEEIGKVVGDKVIEYSDRTKLPYVNATIMEIQRCANIAPLNVVHSTKEESTLAGYTIPKNTLIIPMLYSVSMDTKYFQNPTKFDPNRFIDTRGNLIKNEAVIPFSTGPRVCLGESLARMELFLVFANLLQRFDFARESPEVPNSLNPKLAQITNAPVSYKVRATKRQ